MNICTLMNSLIKHHPFLCKAGCQRAVRAFIEHQTILSTKTEQTSCSIKHTATCLHKLANGAPNLVSQYKAGMHRARQQASVSLSYFFTG